MFALTQKINENKIYRRRRDFRFQKFNRIRVSAKFYRGDKFRFASKVIKFLLDISQNIDIDIAKRLKAPKVLCFKRNFEECVRFIYRIVLSHHEIEGNITIDFSECDDVSVSFLVILKTILEELDLFSERVSQSRFNQLMKTIKLISSKSDIVNRHLNTLNIAKFSVGEEEQKEYLTLGWMRGRSRNYRENQKSKVSHKIALYLENTAERIGVGFNQTGKNYIESMVGEILSNAEDHSLERSEWFVDGVSFLHQDDDNEIIEFNLTILNFGNSMYEGFEQTKEENRATYEIVENLYNQNIPIFNNITKFEREPLFVLYMLNEGISRLKYIRESRGNGTMKFIKSFIDLSKFGNEDKRFKPELSIITGHTVLTCTEEYAPFKTDKHYVLSLNSAQSLKEMPDKSVLKYFNKISFPGTILDCKIYLNKRDLKKNIKLKNKKNF